MAALLALLLLAGSVEIYDPTHAVAGEEVEVVVLVNGVRAPGEVVVTSPAGEEERHAGGYAKFEASAVGEWRVEYAGIERKLVVERSELGKLAEPLAYGATALAALIIAHAYWKSRRKLFVKKRLANGNVEIEVRNGGEELAGVRVIDHVPEDAELDLPAGAKAWESLEGKSVRWSVPVLHAGQRIVLSYGIRTGAKVLQGVEVRASHAREIRAVSDEVRI